MTTIRSKVTAAFDKIAAKQPDAIQVGAVRVVTATPSRPSDTGMPVQLTDDIAARMAVFEIGVASNDFRVDGTNIFAGDYQVIIEPIAVEVTMNDKIVCDRGVLNIRRLGRVASGGETAVYDMVCYS